MKTKTYRASKKARKLWSLQANAKQERERKKKSGGRYEYVGIDPYIKITVERAHTKEVAVFECFEGSRIDNYSIYCNNSHLGIHGITYLMSSIRKALPRFRRFEG